MHISVTQHITTFIYKLQDIQNNNAIHKAAVQPAAVQNGLWRVFCMAASFDILGIIPGKPVERL